VFDPLRSEKPLIVYVDLKSPYAFVALGPTREMAASLGVAIDWRPLTLDIPSFAGSARLGRGDRVVESRRSPAQWTVVKYSYKDARRYGALRGLTVRGTIKIWDTTLAGQGLLWAKAQSDPVLARYLAVIEALLREAGADTAAFASHVESSRADYLACQDAIFDAGIFGVPGYVVDGEYYWGREHLPRIRWILEGRRGPAPDVAYRRVAPESP
jgi:2-hydroxychromene-2-carboxylate isomerase